MRVALHFPDGSVAAYKFGRIEDGVQNMDILTGETVPLAQFVQRVAQLARKEHPEDVKIVIEKMIMHRSPEKAGVSEDSSEWVPLEEFDPESHTPTRAGNQTAVPELRTATAVAPRS